MSKTNFTPGPWRIGKVGSVVSDHPVPEVGGTDHVDYYGGHCICESVSAANAHLIAAAPELYEACDDCLHALRTLTIQGELPDRLIDDLQKHLSAAIDKADGK